MKRTITIFLALLLIVLLASCDGNDSEIYINTDRAETSAEQSNNDDTAAEKNNSSNKSWSKQY